MPQNKAPRRRSRSGDGSVFQLATGKWVARISIGGRQSRRFVSRTRTTQAAATEALRMLRSAYRYATTNDETPLTVDNHLKRWLDVQKPRLRPDTYEGYEATVRLHIEPFIGAYRVDKLREQHVTSLFTELERKGRSAHVRDQVYLRLRSALSSLKAENPVTKEHRPRVPRVPMKVWTQEQSRNFLEAARGDWWEHLYRVALSTGMRMGEILGLRWQDVNLKTRRLAIQNSLSKKGVLGEVKTKYSRRAIELPSKVVSALVDQKTKLKAAGLDKCEWVFPTAAGIPVQRKTLTREFGYMLYRAKTPRIRFHDMRHTAATLRLASGENVKVVSEMLGHSSITVTLNTYSHVLPSMQRESADRFDAIL